MVQVENESGSWNSVRDYSAAAQKLIEGNVPEELLKPEILKELKRPVNSKGTWQEVFEKMRMNIFMPGRLPGTSAMLLRRAKR